MSESKFKIGDNVRICVLGFGIQDGIVTGITPTENDFEIQVEITPFLPIPKEVTEYVMEINEEYGTWIKKID